MSRPFDLGYFAPNPVPSCLREKPRVRFLKMHTAAIIPQEERIEAAVENKKGDMRTSMTEVMRQRLIALPRDTRTQGPMNSTTLGKFRPM